MESITPADNGRMRLQGRSSVAEQAEAKPADGQIPPGAEHPRRRIVTRLHAAGENDRPIHTSDFSTLPVRTCWAAQAWVDGALIESTRHPNRYVLPVNSDTTTMNAAYSQGQAGAGAALWNKISKAIRSAWMRSGRECSGCNEQHGD